MLPHTRMPCFYNTVCSLLAWQTASWGPWWRYKDCVGGMHWRVAFCHIRPSLLSNWHKTLVNSLLPPSLDSLWMWTNNMHSPINNIYAYSVWIRSFRYTVCFSLVLLLLKKDKNVFEISYDLKAVNPPSSHKTISPPLWGSWAKHDRKAGGDCAV